MLTNTFTKSLLAGALLLAGSATFAQTTDTPDSLIVAVYPARQSNKICLAVEKQPNTVAFVQLLSPTGQELYQGYLPKKGAKFNQIFDMNELQDGIYTLRVRQGKDSIVKSVQLQTTTPEPTTSVRFLTLGN